MEIRLARPEEAADALRIIHECGLVMRERFAVPDWLLPQVPAVVAGDAAAARLFVVSEAGAGLIGTFALCDVPDDYYAAIRWEDPTSPAVYLHRFAMNPAWQGRGLGNRCLEFMETLVSRRGRRWIRLDATLADPRARAFYERAGYHGRGNAMIPVGIPNCEAVEVVCYEKRIGGAA
jgi:GNAT superfamily N-acetyltransferase